MTIRECSTARNDEVKSKSQAPLNLGMPTVETTSAKTPKGEDGDKSRPPALPLHPECKWHVCSTDLAPTSDRVQPEHKAVAVECARRRTTMSAGYVTVWCKYTL